jgi:hypothetical protein
MGVINTAKIPVSDEVADLMSGSVVWDNHMRIAKQVWK